MTLWGLNPGQIVPAQQGGLVVGRVRRPRRLEVRGARSRWSQAHLSVDPTRCQFPSPTSPLVNIVQKYVMLSTISTCSKPPSIHTACFILSPCRKIIMGSSHQHPGTVAISMTWHLPTPSRQAWRGSRVRTLRRMVHLTLPLRIRGQTKHPKGGVTIQPHEPRVNTTQTMGPL